MIILMDSYDLRMTLPLEVDLQRLIRAIIRHLNPSAEPLYPCRQMLNAG